MDKKVSNAYLPEPQTLESYPTLGDFMEAGAKRALLSHSVFNSQTKHDTVLARTVCNTSELHQPSVDEEPQTNASMKFFDNKSTKSPGAFLMQSTKLINSTDFELPAIETANMSRILDQSKLMTSIYTPRDKRRANIFSTLRKKSSVEGFNSKIAERIVI